jgi:predicted RNA-binding protein with PUA-like domain
VSGASVCWGGVHDTPGAAFGSIVRHGPDWERTVASGNRGMRVIAGLAYDFPTMTRRYWLMKCEPGAYSIDDLARDGRTSWEGVRNYQARNFIRDDMQEGDRVLFYASNARPSGVAGLATIARSGYPDPFAWKKGHTYFDPASRPDAPTWYMVDVAFVERFPEIVALDVLKSTKGLEQMMVTQKGSRLSIQPVTRPEYDIVVRLGRAKA